MPSIAVAHNVITATEAKALSDAYSPPTGREDYDAQMTNVYRFIKTRAEEGFTSLSDAGGVVYSIETDGVYAAQFVIDMGAQGYDYTITPDNVADASRVGRVITVSWAHLP